jgi:putative ABC transport system permease protein
VLLPDHVQPSALEAHFPDLVATRFPDAIADKTSMYLQPLTDIHLHSNLDFEIEANSSIAYVYIFSVIAVFILVIACINFMNLATARSARRAREVGIRKAVGANRTQLMRQFLSESVVLSLIALLLALPLARALLPMMNAMARKSLAFDVTDGGLLVMLVLVAVMVGVGAGAYPAFLLSAFDPARVLKDSFPLGVEGHSVGLRRALVVVQFALSMVLIVGAIVAFQQLRFLQNARLGFDKEQVVMVPMLGSDLAYHYDTVKEALLQHRGVKAVTVAEDVLGSKYQTGTYRPEGVSDPQQYLRMFVHDDFAEVMGLDLVAGRSFSHARDHGRKESVAIINEAMVRHLDWNQPEAAVGRRLSPGVQVVGVVRDFHYAALHQPVGPFVLHRLHDRPEMLDFFGRYLAVRIEPDRVSATMAHVEATWAQFEPSRLFEYFFMDDDLDQQYRAEATLGQVATAFAMLAIGIAALGLFGLVAYTITQRTKEIGIRKALGASGLSILALLAKDFVRLVGIAFVIALPVAYVCAQQWLSGFAYRTTLHPWVFGLAGGLALTVALLTISVQSLKVARANPADSLQE